MTLVDDFAADYFVRERISPPRRLDTLETLAALAAHAGAPVEALDERQVQAFVTHLIGRGLSPSTVRWRLSMVKPFYRWAWERRHIDADRQMRIARIRPPRGGKTRPRPYKRTEVERFWEALDARWPLAPDERLRRYHKGVARYRRVYPHAQHLMTEAIASLALFGGLRRSEIWRATIHDIHPDNEFIVVHGKTEVWEDPKLREVPYTDAGRDAIARWLEFRETLAPGHDSPWVSLRPTSSPVRLPVGAQMNFDAFKRVLMRVPDGPGEHWSLHRFRHTAATEWLRAGMELQEVSRLLGHATIQQTLVYAEIAKGDVQRSVERHQRKFTAAVGRPK